MGLLLNCIVIYSALLLVLPLRLLLWWRLEDLRIDFELSLVKGEAAAVAEPEVGAVGHAGGAVGAGDALARSAPAGRVGALARAVLAVDLGPLTPAPF